MNQPLIKPIEAVTRSAPRRDWVARGLAIVAIGVSLLFRPVIIEAPAAVELRQGAVETIHHSDYQQPAAMSGDVYWALHHASAEWNVAMSTMARVSRCESTWNPAACSRSGRYLGLFQHHRSYWPGRVGSFNDYVALHNSREPNKLEQMAGDVFAAIDNARVTAWMVAHKTGWKPWGCRP